MKNLLIFGAPGVGKGTQSAFLAEKFSLSQLSTGDLLRREIAAATPLGKRIADLVAGGKLVSDEIVMKLLAAAMAKTEGGLILDGFPRTVNQAEQLDDLFATLGKKSAAVIYLKLDESALLERVVGRLSCGGCGAVYHRKFMPPRVAGKCDDCGGELGHRPDDNPITVKTRLAEYRQKTMPLLEFYRNKGLLKEIDGDGTAAEVSARIVASI